jgi:hypothetical protein
MVTTKAALGRNTTPPRIYAMLKPETVMRLTQLHDVAPVARQNPRCSSKAILKRVSEHEMG